MIESLRDKLIETYEDKIQWASYDDIPTIITPLHQYIGTCQILKNEFDQLTDLTIIDNLTYGQSEWTTSSATSTGFSRGQLPRDLEKALIAGRFEIVIHLLSYTHNQRLRLRCLLDDNVQIESLCSLWPSANWYEREAFDLFGVYFLSHPDLRRILTDYGFNGHPFRKDFPMVGFDQLIYDGSLERCRTEPVNIELRTVIPKVCRS